MASAVARCSLPLRDSFFPIRKLKVRTAWIYETESAPNH